MATCINIKILMYPFEIYADIAFVVYVFLVNETHASTIIPSLTEIKDLHVREDVGVHEQPEEHGAGEE